MGSLAEVGVERAYGRTFLSSSEPMAKTLVSSHLYSFCLSILAREDLEFGMRGDFFGFGFGFGLGFGMEIDVGSVDEFVSVRVLVVEMILDRKERGYTMS